MITVSSKTIDVIDWYLVFTNSGMERQDWVDSYYEEKKKYKVEDWLFIEVKE